MEVTKNKRSNSSASQLKDPDLTRVSCGTTKNVETEPTTQSLQTQAEYFDRMKPIMHQVPPPPPPHQHHSNADPMFPRPPTHYYQGPPPPPFPQPTPSSNNESTSADRQPPSSAHILHPEVPPPPPIQQPHSFPTTHPNIFPTPYVMHHHPTNQSVMQQQLNQQQQQPNPHVLFMDPQQQQQYSQQPLLGGTHHPSLYPPQPTTTPRSHPSSCCRWLSHLISTRHHTTSQLGYCPFTRGFQITLFVYLLLSFILLFFSFDFLGTPVKMAATALAFLGIKRKDNVLMGIFTGILAYDLVGWSMLMMGRVTHQRWSYRALRSTFSVWLVFLVFIVQQALLVLSIIHLKSGPNPHQSRYEQQVEPSTTTTTATEWSTEQQQQAQQQQQQPIDVTPNMNVSPPMAQPSTPLTPHHSQQ